MKWKHILRYPLDIRVAHRALQSATLDASSDGWNETLGIDLYSDQLLFDCGRHLTCIAAHAAKSRRRVVLRCDAVLLAAIAHKNLGAQFLSMPHVSWISAEDSFPADSVVLTDAPVPAQRAQPKQPSRGPRDTEHQHVVAMLIGRDVVPGTAIMPYPMFPTQIESFTKQSADHFRALPKAGVFFAGNQKNRYGRESMRNEFGVLSRLEILTELKRRFPARVVSRNSQGMRDRIVLRDSHTDPIAANEWMPTLAEHRFFLCCPGVSQPVCHNIIEAMSIGLIPILEYDQRFSPALRDGVNAICFREQTGLVEAIDRIDALTESECQRLSANVCEYYDQHLCGVRFLDEVYMRARDQDVSAISMPFHNRNFFTPVHTTSLLRAA